MIDIRKFNDVCGGRIRRAVLNDLTGGINAPDVAVGIGDRARRAGYGGTVCRFIWQAGIEARAWKQERRRSLRRIGCGRACPSVPGCGFAKPLAAGVAMPQDAVDVADFRDVGRCGIGGAVDCNLRAGCERPGVAEAVGNDTGCRRNRCAVQRRCRKSRDDRQRRRTWIKALPWPLRWMVSKILAGLMLIAQRAE